ncbi:taste receptor type 2 member 40-like [Leptodactylus fuscus]|uniref:taste receptor type 2 member 40-like n=1 Tax=Leptodactylus fuscus TaxID=238119 RepID=UPI003F4E8FB1
MEFYEYFIAALVYGECTVGILLNGFIVATNFKNWRTLKTLPPCDKILSCLATSRCLFLFYTMAVNVLFLFFPQLTLYPYFFTSVLVCTMLLNLTNLWLATILCVFYCVKITNYSHKFFIFLKTRISSLVNWFLLASLLISIAYSLSYGWYVSGLDPQKHISSSSENTTFSKGVTNPETHNRLIMFIMGSFPPFVIFIVAIILLIHSLWAHIRHMRGNGTGFRGPNLEVHFGAVKSMSLFLVLHAVYFVCMSVRESPTYGGPLKLVISLLACCLPFLHSLYIIFSTKKLKEELIRWFCCK